MSSSQVWRVPLSTAQRWVLYNLSHAEGQKVSGQEGRRYRRFLKAFGLAHIGEVLRRGKGVPVKVAADERTIALHEVTAENVEYALKVAAGERTPLEEDIVGELFDLLEDLKGGRVNYVEPDGVADFDLEADRKRWDATPDSEEEPSQPPPAAAAALAS